MIQQVGFEECASDQLADSAVVAPAGLRLASEHHRQFGVLPDISIRCRSQAPDTAPLFSRPRLRWNLHEVAGALGDLGTFLPHIIAAITVVGMAPSSVFVSFGLFYLFSGLFYGVPMGVQPMKAASVALLVQHLTPGEVAGAGLVIGCFFLVAGWSGLITRIARAIPSTVVAGLQLGLGFSLAGIGIRMIEQQLWLGILMVALMLVLMTSRRLPAALVACVVGVGLSQVFGIGAPIPHLSLGFHLPGMVWPTWHDIVRGTEVAVLPQIPLTLTNAVIVTAAVTRQLLPKEAHPVTERNLALTTGIGNLLSAPFGGYLMCHGAGGITGHYRFGSRTGMAPVLVGLTFLVLGVLLGDGALGLVMLIPAAMLGSMLFFSGVELALSSRLQQYADADLFVVLFIGAISVAVNPALAFLVGLPIAYASERGWLHR